MAWDETAMLLSDRGVLLLVKRCVHSVAGGHEGLRSAAPLLHCCPCLECAADIQVCQAFQVLQADVLCVLRTQSKI